MPEVWVLVLGEEFSGAPSRGRPDRGELAERLDGGVMAALRETVMGAPGPTAPALREAALGELALRELALWEAALVAPVLRGPLLGEPALGETALEDPLLAEIALGEPLLEGPVPGETAPRASAPGPAAPGPAELALLAVRGKSVSGAPSPSRRGPEVRLLEAACPAAWFAAGAPNER
ncbi:hypothetical protein [Kineosporia babensis]|uniref:hypothetical protein n=1 Tax=Kineosporia babensis TaxID=499548 RepID=UPI0022B072A2|nr:hypothetical protein [Kineosporia babensis]